MEQRQIWRCGCLEERVAKGGQGIGCERGDESFICGGKIQMGVEWRWVTINHVNWGGKLEIEVKSFAA